MCYTINRRAERSCNLHCRTRKQEEGKEMSWSMFPPISATGAVVPSTSILFPPPRRPSSSSYGGVGLLVIECSSRPQKKATAHHMKTRPRKTQQWDIKRKPTVYAPLPPLPPDWTPLAPQSQPAAADGSDSPTTTTATAA